MTPDVSSHLNTVGGNRHPAAADWHGEILAFGADRNVALWKPLDEIHRGIYAILSGHTDIVNVVRFLPLPGSRPAIVSGSVDKTIALWIASEIDGEAEYTRSKVLTEHEGSINTISVCRDANVFVSGSADGKVNIWRYLTERETHQINIEHLQALTLSPKYIPLASALIHLESSNSFVLAVAGTKSTIQVFVSQDNKFEAVASLAGHEGWIRSLSFVKERETAESDILLASASQDKYIRLWRFHHGDPLVQVNEATNDAAFGNITKSLSNKAHRFETRADQYNITFEALLIGHEDWIFTVQWHKTTDGIRLLSASADSSVAIWEADPSSGVWLSSVRLGEISSQKGATTATGSTGGYWIGLWSPGGMAVTSLSRTGSWRLWEHNLHDDRWVQRVAVTGHTKEVRDVAWARDGSYLLTTSADQTTRLFSEWKRNHVSSWHEFSRPQIHGYDLNCINAINDTEFISGADEKLLRVFDQPRAVADSLTRFCGIASASSKSLPDAANIPVLGLSNKAITNDDTQETELAAEEDHTQEPNESFPGEKQLESLEPPVEDLLARHLLWPEIEKLYGHGYEISTAAVSHSMNVVATACRASSLDHAVIRMYETKTWREVKPALTAHSLTVTSIAFSPDDKYLLSVGRDRQCAVFEQDATDPLAYKRTAANPKAHSRMILDCAWTPLAKDYLFATAGRDKVIKTWRLIGGVIETLSSIATVLPVTTIDFLPQKLIDSFLVAYGLENGSVNVCHLNSQTLEVAGEVTINPSLFPSKSITRLAWRPRQSHIVKNGTAAEDADVQVAEIAVSSEDCSVRTYGIPIR